LPTFYPDSFVITSMPFTLSVLPSELRELILRFRPDVVIVDMETASLTEVEQMHRDFTSVCIVCTHRIADEEMWTAALDAGAADICSATDTHGILAAAMRNTSLARSAAA